MPNYGTYAICPYFMSEDLTGIRCEGIVKENNATTVMRFRNSKAKKAWLDKYCEKREYCNCPYAKILEKKYQEAMQ